MLLVGAVLAIVLVPARAAGGVSLALVLSGVVLIPTSTPSKVVQVAALACYVAILTIGLFRSRAKIVLDGASGLLALFLFVKVLTNAQGAGLDTLMMGLLSSVFLFAAYFVVRSVGIGEPVFRRTALSLLVLQVFLGILELIFKIPAAWPALSVTDSSLSSRPNHLAPFLEGRVLGTTSHPILYGVACLVCWYVVTAGPGHVMRRGLPATLLCLAALVMSGSRGVLLVLIAVLLFRAVRAARPWLAPAYVIAGACALYVGTNADVLRLLGFSGFDGSISYLQRSQVIESLPRLLDQPFGQLALGHGAGGAEKLFNLGYLVGGGLTVIDNQFIATLVSNGLLGLGLLLLVIAVHFVRGGASSRVLLVAVVGLSLSFNVLNHNVSAFAFVLAIGLAGHSDNAAVDPSPASVGRRALTEKVGTKLVT